MEFEIFGTAKLLARRNSDKGRLDRFRTQNREITDHNPQFAVIPDQLDQIIECGFAIAAIIIEKLDQRHIALGIADHC